MSRALFLFARLVYRAGVMPRNPASPSRAARVADPAGPVAGVILAGGLSRRMGGGDKCLLPLGGRPILAHVIERLRPQVGPLVLNANGDPGRFAAFGLPVVADGWPGFAGPLAGLLAGMDWAAARGLPLVATAAADTPFFPRDLVARLGGAMAAAGAPIALAAAMAEGEAGAAGRAGAPGLAPAGGLADGLADEGAGRTAGAAAVARHPTFGLWSTGLREDLRAALGRGVRRVSEWAADQGAAEAVFPGGEQAFFNVNWPDDLRRAERGLAVAP